MSLSQRLYTLMRWRGIKSQSQLARISGVPQSCIHRILTRRDGYSPSRATLLRLARALDTCVPWLTDGVMPGADASGCPARGRKTMPTATMPKSARCCASSRPPPRKPCSWRCA